MKKHHTFQYVLLSLCISLFTPSCFAQMQRDVVNVDSLATVNERYKKQDETKLIMLNQLAMGYEKSNPDKGITTSEQAIALAQKLNKPLLLAEAYNNKGANHEAKSQYPEALELFKKALEINTRLNNMFGMAANYYNLSRIYYRKGDNQSALEHCEKALFIFEDLRINEGMAKCFTLLGAIYLLNENGKALEYFQKAFGMNEKLGNKSNMAANLGNIGIIYSNLSDYPKALEFYQKASVINEQLENKYSVAENFLNIGVVYLNLSDYPKALEYYDKSLSICEQLENKYCIAANLGNIGLVYSNLSDYPSALTYYKRALSILEQLGSNRGISNNLSNIGYVYQNLSDSACMRLGIAPEEKYAKALEYLQRALSLNEQLENKRGMAFNLIKIGSIYSDAPVTLLPIIGIKSSERFARVLEVYQEALNIGTEIGNLDLQMDAWENLSATYEKQGNFSKAFDAYKKHITLRDSIQGEEVKNEITRKEMQYEFDKKETEIKFQQQLTEEQLQRSQSELSLKNTERNASIAGTGILMVGLLFVFRQRNKLKKTNNLLDDTNKQLDSTNRNLHETQSQLVQQEKLASLGALTAGIAHEIKNPLNFVTNFSELSNELIDELETVTDPEERTELLEMIKDNLNKINLHGRRADDIVKSMLEHSRSSSAEKQPTDVNKLLEEFANIAYHGIQTTVPDFKCSIEKNLAPEVAELMLVQQDIGRVLLNVFNNAFYAVKHKPDGKLTITTALKNNQFLLSIRDNGSGMSEEVKNKIFEPFFTTKPTGQGTGLGLSLSFDIVKAHGGSIAVQSKVGEGTEFSIQLPVLV